MSLKESLLQFIKRASVYFCLNSLSVCSFFQFSILSSLSNLSIQSTSVQFYHARMIEFCFVQYFVLFGPNCPTCPMHLDLSKLSFLAFLVNFVQYFIFVKGNIALCRLKQDSILFRGETGETHKMLPFDEFF